MYNENGNSNRRPRRVGRRARMDQGYMGMISADRSAVANLPKEVVQEAYPKSRYFDGYYLDDTQRGIDDNVDNSIRKIEGHQSDSMY